jgi:acetyl/propionyl-CoA carboxylase alpha subunit
VTTLHGIDTVLVANRGEIALRVMRTAHAMGLRTVAVYTRPDLDAPHVRAADEAVAISSYLDIADIAGAARHRGAQLVHPGYGFLSERAAFAREIEGTEPLVLVGPSSGVMEAMGKKDAARDIAMAAGVPVVPAYDLDADPAHFAYPVLVKAAAGGGGKGMRIVRSRDEYDAALAAARREALGAFGDDTILVEKYVEHGRHIEVQVLADHHGNVVHLFERDCSTQRRHQKVLEEAPAPTITDDQRELVTSSAVALCREVGYTNAGTVEFLLDSDSGEVYFLEMNTRLQVEHPVTEEVVRVRGERIDLVELQLRVAAGEPLGFAQEDVSLEGHAIEARIYAEDSFGGFLPQAGTAELVRWPAAPFADTGAPVRVDAALESGQVVSSSFDPMLGKVIARGEDREDARLRLVDALDRTAILGLTTNTGFVRALAAGPEFRDAAIDTAWLDRATLEAPRAEVALVAAAWVDAVLHSPRFTDTPGDPFATDGWRVAGEPARTLVALETPDGRRELRVDVPGGRVDDVVVSEHVLADHAAVLSLDGHRETTYVNATAHKVEVAHRGQRYSFERPDAFADHGPAAGDGTLVAPMPGTVLDVHVTVGQQVAAGETLGAMEAMKMELALTAPFSGTVTEVNVAAGDQVPLGAVLLVVEADDA